MATGGFETARLADLERADGWAPIRKALGIRSFGINAWTSDEAGGTLIPEHDERPSGHEELYLVISGSATFTVDGEVLDAPAGTAVFLRDPSLTRAALAASPGTTVVSVGGAPGQAFAPRSWEINRDVFALLDAGQASAAKEILTSALREYEDRGFIFYNLACAEAQLGETEAALGHLGSAIRQEPDLRQSAKHDGDLEPLRAHPRFREIVGSP